MEATRQANDKLDDILDFLNEDGEVPVTLSLLLLDRY